MTNSSYKNKVLAKNKGKEQKGRSINMWYGVLNRAMIPIALAGAFGLYTRKYRKKHNKTKKRKKTKK